MKSHLSLENILVLHLKRKHLISQTRDTKLQTAVTIPKKTNTIVSAENHENHPFSYKMTNMMSQHESAHHVCHLQT